MDRDSLLNILRQRTYLNYSGPKASDADEISRLEEQFIQGTGSKLPRTTMHKLFDTSNPKEFASRWASVKAALPDGKWYLSASINPPAKDLQDKPASIIFGQVRQRAKRVVTVNGKERSLDLIFLEPGAIRDRQSQKFGSQSPWAVAGTDVVIYQDMLDKNLETWRTLSQGAAQMDLKGWRERLCLSAKKPNDLDWNEVGEFLMAHPLADLKPEELSDWYLGTVGFLAAGQMDALDDPDFQFFVQHRALSEEEQAQILRWRGYVAELCDGNSPDFEAGIIALGMSADSAKSTPVLYSACGTTMYNLSRQLGDLPPIDAVNAEIKLDQTLLKPDLGPSEIREAARKQRAPTLAQINMRLVASLSAQGPIPSADKDAVLTAVDHALRDCPDGDLVKMTAGEVYVQSGRQEKGEKLLIEVSKNNKAPFFQAGTNQGLGILYFEQQKYSLAIEKLEQSEMLVEEPTTLYFLTKAYKAAGRKADAEKVQQEFLKLEPTGPRADEIR